MPILAKVLEKVCKLQWHGHEKHERMKMRNLRNIVIMAANQAFEPVTESFAALVWLVKDEKLKSDCMILVQRDKDGKVTVSETGDHLGRNGAGWGVGVLVDLLAPPMLASTVSRKP